jgi:hypothetical protein
VFRRCLSGDPVGGIDLNAVLEWNSCNHFGKVIKSPLPSPGLLGGLAQFKQHVQHALSRETALGALGPMTNRGEGRFDRIGGADALPVLGRKILEGQQFVPIPIQAFNRLGIFGFIKCGELNACALGILLRVRLPDVVQ